MKTSQAGWLLRAVAVAAIAFGLLTVASGGLTLFGGASHRQAAGAYVPFVLWFNFLAGFAYVLAGAGLWLNRRWAVSLAGAICAATLLVFAAFWMHVLGGGAYKMRTAGAMTLRCLVWAGIALLAYKKIWHE